MGGERDVVSPIRIVLWFLQVAAMPAVRVRCVQETIANCCWMKVVRQQDQVTHFNWPQGSSRRTAGDAAGADGCLATAAPVKTPRRARPSIILLYWTSITRQRLSSWQSDALDAVKLLSKERWLGGLNLDLPVCQARSSPASHQATTLPFLSHCI